MKHLNWFKKLYICRRNSNIERIVIVRRKLQQNHLNNIKKIISDSDSITIKTVNSYLVQEFEFYLKRR